MPTYRSRMTDDLAKFRDRLYRGMTTPLADLDVAAWRTEEPVSYADRESGEAFRPVPGERWGRLFDCAWFHFTGTVPADAKGREVALMIELGGEGLVVDPDGQPVLGLTNALVNIPHAIGQTAKRLVPFAKRAKGGEPVDLWVDAGHNSLFGEHEAWGHQFGPFQQPRIVAVNTNIRGLYFDFEVLFDLMMALPEDSARRARILTALADVVLATQVLDEKSAARARKVLAPELARCGGDPSFSLSAIGHAHIDLAWLWPLRETYRKGARTFSTVFRLMERYPGYVFGQSMPQLYKWMRDQYPVVWKQIKKYEKAGRWEAMGDLWVEPDINMSSGEALVRQILFGKRFFRKEFGRDSRIAFIPDSFGYSGAFPQILRKSGIDFFITQKLSWDRYKKYPHHSFWWKGIDGTSILTHLLPEDTYNSNAQPSAMVFSEKNYLDKEVSGHALVAFGIGDGGGGPGEEHLERLERTRNLAGMPPITVEPVRDFHEKFRAEAHRFETWSGELYLSCHQGTYTSQAKNKRGNRRMEIALRNYELLAVLAERHVGWKTPQSELDAIWEDVLLFQFHDILPGSSITRVHRESQARYEELLADMAERTAAVASALAAQIDPGQARDPLAIINTLCWRRDEWIQHGGRWLRAGADPLGHAVIDASADPDIPSSELKATRTLLENDILRVTFAKDGTITSVYDKQHGRETIEEGGRANLFSVYEDPGDAWDFVIQHEGQQPARFELVSASAGVDGPCARMVQQRRFNDSSLEQEILLRHGSRRLEFRTRVDWRERNRMLRVAFPTTVFSNEVNCEIQFGAIRRPTHRNTVWEQSMFEVCAHRWVDLSDGGYGCALLNDCKYGHKLHGSTLDLNLLRSACLPDPVADEGEHEFTYAFYPHVGDAVSGGVVREAHALNNPLLVLPAGPGSQLPATASFLDPQWTELPDNVVLETVKKSEDGKGVVVRLYETAGQHCTASFKTTVAVKEAKLTNMIEEEPEPAAFKDGRVDLVFGPFEVKTVYLRG